MDSSGFCQMWKSADNLSKKQTKLDIPFSMEKVIILKIRENYYYHIIDISNIILSVWFEAIFAHFSRQILLIFFDDLDNGQTFP